MHVCIFGEQVHVPKAVNGNQWQVILGFTQVVQGMSKFHSIGNEEIDILCKK
jgi:hypothetical protein